MFIYPNTNIEDATKITSPIFKHVETLFCNWIETQSRHVTDMFYSDDAIYSQRGIVEETILAAHDIAVETNAPVRLSSMEFDV